MVRDYCRVSEYEGDDFVGLRFVDEQPVVVFPRGFAISDDEHQLRCDVLRLLSTIAKFSGHREGEKISNSVGTATLTFPYLSYQYIIYDFLTHGYYSENEEKYITQSRGKINWKRTIQQLTPQIDNGNAVYLSFVVKQSRVNDSSLLTRIHEYCVYTSFLRFGWLYTDTEALPQKPSIKLNKRLFLAALKNALSNTFNEQKKMLFQSMINIISELEEQSAQSNATAFGVERFDHVWEGMIDYVYGDDNREAYNPHATWAILQGRGRRFQSSELRPDTVVKLNDKLFIIDAKYYKYGITLNPAHLPPTDSIQKQITYGAYAERMQYAERDRIFNAFIMPFHSPDDEPYKFVTVGMADWIRYDANSPNYDYVLGILLDTTHLLRSYTKHSFSEIDRLTTLIEESIDSYKAANT